MDISVVELAFLLENQMSGVLIRGRTDAAPLAVYWIGLILPRMLHVLCLPQVLAYLEYLIFRLMRSIRLPSRDMSQRVQLPCLSYLYLYLKPLQSLLICPILLYSK